MVKLPSFDNEPVTIREPVGTNITGSVASAPLFLTIHFEFETFTPLLSVKVVFANVTLPVVDMFCTVPIDAVIFAVLCRYLGYGSIPSLPVSINGLANFKPSITN